MKIQIKAEVPDALARAWLQHLRDFDTDNPGCHFQIDAWETEIGTDEMTRILESIDPPFASGVQRFSKQ
jgi:hypothetical protein